MQRFLSIAFLFFNLFIVAQTGRVSGTILDAKTGETLPGATVLVEGTSKGAAADFDGKFAINNVPVGKVTLVVSYISYTTKKIANVDVPANDVTYVHIQLEPSAANDLQEVEVVVTLNKENNTALVLQQKNSASVSDGISAETIRRTPDRNTSDVLKRVSGASIQDNKFAIVRGLNERYNAAYLNGAPLPSSESDRKAFAFDIFPSNMLDNLVITKTARPDLPGEFAGGVIDVTTKSIPEKNFIFVSAQGGYNTLATFKQKYYYKGGNTDWLGLDDGTRKLPSFVPDQAHFPNPPLQDPQNFQQNSDLAKQVSQSSVNNWAYYNNKNFMPNLAFQLSGGYNFKRKEQDFFGVIAALTYNSTNTHTTAVRTDYQNNKVTTNPGSAASVVSSSLTDQGYNKQVLAGALLNLSCKINPDNSISLKNLYSINSSDQTTLRTGLTQLENGRGTASHAKSTIFWFTGNRIFSSQLIGEHFLKAPKLRINWIGAYSTVVRDIPDMRINATGAQSTDSTAYTLNLGSSTSSDGSYSGSMFWSHLTENIKSGKGDVQRDFKVAENFNFNLKLGSYYQYRYRTFSARQLGYETSNGHSFLPGISNLQADQAFVSSNIATLNNGIPKTGLILAEGTKSQDSYNASAELKAAYLMADMKIFKWLRIVGGERVESYYQKLIVLTNGGNPTTYPSTKVDWLPSANFIFALNDKQNIRASYSKTLNRPEFRELAPFLFYDFNTLFTTTGQQNLKRASISNYDLRYEIFPGRGQLLSASAFYKDFMDPIEQIAGNQGDNEITYGNQPEAKIYGAELEGRIVIGSFFKGDSSQISKILNNLTVFANYAYIRSSVVIAWPANGRPIGAPTTRPLQGQSPYIINAGITYADNDLGYSISAIVNRVGQRLYIVGNYATQPGIWEQGRTVLDIQASKSFLKNRLEVRATARDILARWQPQYLFYDNNNNLKFDKGKDDLAREVHFGTTYAIQVTYKF